MMRSVAIIVVLTLLQCSLIRAPVYRVLAWKHGQRTQLHVLRHFPAFNYFPAEIGAINGPVLALCIVFFLVFPVNNLRAMFANIHAGLAGTVEMVDQCFFGDDLFAAIVGACDGCMPAVRVDGVGCEETLFAVPSPQVSDIALDDEECFFMVDYFVGK